MKSKFLPILTTLVASVGVSLAGTTLTSKWALTPGSVPYLTTAGNSERGIAYVPAAGAEPAKILLITRANYAENGGTAAANRIVALSAADGSFIASRLLTASEISSGTFVLNMIGVADDGVIYFANLTTGTGNGPLKIYRLASLNASSPVTVAYTGNPDGNRWGDSLAVTGSGTNTRIALLNSVTGATVLTTTDGSAYTASLYATMVEAGGGKGVSFGLDSNNTSNLLWTKASGGGKQTRASTYTVGTTSFAQVSGTVLPVTGTNNIVALGFDPVSKRLATLETGSTSPEKISVWDASNPAAGPAVLATATLPTDNTNTNQVGSIVLRNDSIYVCDTNNGLVAYNVNTTVDIVAPAISTQPASITAFSNGQVSLSVAATGTPPLTYKWFKDTVEIPNTNNRTLTINPLAESHAGSYTCDVSNASPTVAKSTAAVLTVTPSVTSGVLTKCWEIQANSRPYFSSGDFERGVDASTDGTELYLVSRSTATPSIQVLAATTGDLLRTLDTSPATVTGGIFSLNMVGAGDDGKIYGTNLSTDGLGFKIYQWDNSQSATAPAVAYSGSLMGTRVGDSLDVRGSGFGVNPLQIAVGARSTNQFTIFTRHPDTGVLTPTVFTIPTAPAGAFGLSVAFGRGNTLYGKGAGLALIKVGFDVATGTATILRTFPASVPTSITGLAVDEANGIFIGSQITNSDNARLFRLDYHPSLAGLTTQDQEFYTLNNDNINSVGSAVIRGNKAYLLNTNNALACYEIALSPLPPAITSVKRSTSTPGAWEVKLAANRSEAYEIEYSTDLLPNAWQSVGSVGMSNVEETILVTPDAGEARYFWRAVKQ